MKKIFFIIISVFFALNILHNTFADTDKEYDTAIQYYNNGEYREAINLLKVYVTKIPEPSAYYRIGYALYKLKKFDEASKYFEITYLVDPVFSPQKTGLPELPEDMKRISKPRKKALLKDDMPSAEIKAEQTGEGPEPITEKGHLEDIKPVETQKPALTPEKKPSLQEPQESDDTSPPVMFPKQPVRKMPLPPMGASILSVWIITILFLIEIAIYIFFSSCLYIIAKKLNVTAPWTAWIPIVQIWTIVASAGKPWWWILLLLVPIINFVIGIYLWMLITENLGRNKWLGLLMLIPIVNIVFLGMLAFSKTEGIYTAEAEA
ncbi:MAG: tetratricopeptide repeat protein [Nitrospirae bacterium]|nr:tetratricopeptide repeat protein [Nitrospirota bacterium]